VDVVVLLDPPTPVEVLVPVDPLEPVLLPVAALLVTPVDPTGPLPPVPTVELPVVPAVDDPPEPEITLSSSDSPSAHAKISMPAAKQIRRAGPRTDTLLNAWPCPSLQQKATISTTTNSFMRANG
jgi:hypothetical protein